MLRMLLIKGRCESDLSTPLTPPPYQRKAGLFMRRTIVLLATMALTLLVASGVALAITKIGGPGPNTLRGTNGADNLLGKGGLAGGNERRPFGGDKNLVGGPGNDGVQGGIGADNLFGVSGDDFVHGDNGADRAVGGEGRDFIDGASGPDQ